jgi:uncharacterized protein with ParB-like and HNH nuclease domain
MQAAEAKVQKVLERCEQFLVPHYQRPYSWTEKQWDTCIRSSNRAADWSLAVA